MLGSRADAYPRRASAVGKGLRHRGASPGKAHQGLCPCHPALAREASGAGEVKRFPLSLRRLFWVGVGSRVRFARASVRRDKSRRAGGAAPDPAGSGVLLLWLLPPAGLTFI